MPGLYYIFPNTPHSFLRQMASTALFISLLHLSATWATASFEPFPYDPGFDIQCVAGLAQSLPSHSWEFGTASEALLELYHPEYSVYGDKPFPVPTLQPEDIDSLCYAQSVITIGTGPNSLADGDGAVGDPGSLGVSAVLIGKTNQTYADAAASELDYIVNCAPRFWNGAISQRVSVPELW